MAALTRSRVFHGWWIVLVALVAMFAATLTGGSGFSIFVLPMAQELGWARATLAGALSLGTLLGALSAPIFGRLVDRYGGRVMLTATGLGLAATLVPIAWVHTPLFFYLCYSSARLIDMGLLNTAATTAVANWFIRLRGRALGLTMAGNALGVAIATPLAQWMIVTWNWRVAWLVLSLTGVLLLTPLAWWLVRRRPEDLGLYPDGDTRPRRVEGDAQPPREQTSTDWSLRAALRTTTFWLLVVSSACTTISVAGLSFHQAPILVGNGLAPSTVAGLVGLYGLAWAGGSVLWGLVAERVPARFALLGTNLLIGACMLGVTQVADVSAGIAFATVYGLMNGGKETIDALVWANYYGRRSLGAIRGMSRPLIVGANAGGGLVAGLAYDTLHSYDLVMTVFALLAIGGGFVALLARPPRAPSRSSLSAHG
jgi:MFS family permease